MLFVNVQKVSVMRGWRLNFSILLSLVLLGSAHAATTTIDFENTTVVALGEEVSNQFSSQGVIFEKGYNTFPTLSYEQGVLPLSIGIVPGGAYVTEWNFVDPVLQTLRVVDRVTVKIGTANLAGGNVLYLRAYDGNGQKIVENQYSQGNLSKSLSVSASGISSIQLSVAAGYPPAIKELEYEYDIPPTATLIFRESSDNAINIFWEPFFAGSRIPGWDHVGLHIDNKVYESTPGYTAGNYVSSAKLNPAESVPVPEFFGVQSHHTRKTFIHNAIASKPTGTSDYREIKLDYDLGKKLEKTISEVVGASYVEISLASALNWKETLSASNQKGENGPVNFTCVGLIEWAAEENGVNNFQGFIPNHLEQTPLGFPALTPSKMAYWFDLREKHPKIAAILENPSNENYLYGFSDPVDFLITDPLGRRLGYTESTGELNEIPFSFYSGNGEVEQFLIPLTLPGEYRVDLIGLGEKAILDLATGQHELVQVDQLMADGETSSRTLTMSISGDTKGDVNQDGELTDEDVTLLVTLLDQTVSLTHPGDLDGDSLITEDDVELLKELLEYMEPELTCAGLTPTIVGTSGDDVLYGTEGDDVIKALAGNDSVYGLGGNDTICGGAGNDVLLGGEGNDHIRGNRGADRLSGNKGKDVLRGGRGADHLLGGKGDDKLYGRRGRDTLDGGKGFDDCRGGKGADTAIRCETVRNAQ